MTKRAFVFPGQGSQTLGMGLEFYQNFAVAKEVFEAVDEVLQRKLSAIIFEGPIEALVATENSQPAIMATSIAILQSLLAAVDKPVESLCDFVAGHSLGEYSALCAAGALSLQDTASLLDTRGKAMAAAGELHAGSMAAILGLDVSDIDNVINTTLQQSDNSSVLQIANDNCDGQIVISGSKVAILKAIEVAKQLGAKRAIELSVSGAFHSALMQPATSTLQTAIEQTTFKPLTVPLIANVTAETVSNSEQCKQLLVQQVTSRVRWRETLLYMEQEGVEEIVEIGNGKVLSGLVGRTCPNIKATPICNLEKFAEFLENM